MDLKGKVVVIIGGTSGIGFRIVKKLLITEIEVIALFELQSPSFMKVFSELEKQYGKGIDFYPCDVANTLQLEVSPDFVNILIENFNKLFEKYKTLDILINNPGVVNENYPGRMIDINYKASVLGSLMMIDRVGKHKDGEGGLIINIASIAGLMNFVEPIYCSTKHAVISFTRTMKEHFDKTGVCVTAICSGATNTPMVHELSKRLDFIDTNPILQRYSILQSPYNVADAVIRVIEEGQSGDVRVSEENKPAYTIKAVEDYKSLRIN